MSDAADCETRVAELENLLRQALGEIRQNRAAIADLSDCSRFYRDRGDRLAARVAALEQLVREHDELAVDYAEEFRPRVCESLSVVAAIGSGLATVRLPETPTRKLAACE